MAIGPMSSGSGQPEKATPSRVEEPAALPWDSSVPQSSRRMIEAAIDAFAARGYHATTTRDIATRAGLSPAALYVHFPSKAALLVEISRTGHEAAAELVDNSIASGPDPLSRLRAVISNFASWHAEYHQVARVVQQELAALPDDDRHEVLRLRQQIERRVEDQLRDGVRSGQMKVDDTKAVARALLSLSVDVARWYVPGGRDTPQSIGDLYADLATRMVSAR
jgi:AcrR family transcriptional regulator